jgi:hypothetical protein
MYFHEELLQKQCSIANWNANYGYIVIKISTQNNFSIVKIFEIWKWRTIFCRESRESPSDEAQQRRNEAAELFRSRRHVSVEDTISMHSELALPTTATEVRAQEEPQERREVTPHYSPKAYLSYRVYHFVFNLFSLIFSCVLFLSVFILICPRTKSAFLGILLYFVIIPDKIVA